tara:strand:+ start:34 stop:774 length:741 start_codon:yes stop_codon:yes gene_type:complete
MKFNNKVVLVTGSSQGIGAELISYFHKEGAKVVINYNSSKLKAKTLYENLGNTDNLLIVKADVSKYSQVQEMFDKIIKKFGKLDILINNAAIYEDSTIWNMSKKTWSRVIETDLTGIFNCTKFASKIMKENKYGRILNMSSVVGQTSSFGTSNYAAAKSGILGFSRVVATELARYNITVNTLSLGFIDTGMLHKLSEEVRKKILKQIPLGRWGSIEDVTFAVSFICSEETGYITGQSINLNGGYLM